MTKNRKLAQFGWCLLTSLCLLVFGWQSRTAWLSLRTSISPELASHAKIVQGTAALEQLKQQGVYASLSDAVLAAQYGVKPVLQSSSQASQASYVANNPAQHLQTHFTADGIELMPAHRGETGWRLGVALRSAGYGNRQSALRAGVLAVAGNRTEYTRTLNARTNAVSASVKEWYVNTPSGLEQGFTLAEPLGERHKGERLRLTLALDTDLRARAVEAGEAIEFLDTAGANVLRYDKLAVWDARGEKLAARLKLQAQSLLIEVADAEAVYPITIDPNFSQQAYIKASNTQTTDLFGLAVAVAGDTVVVGASQEDSNATGVNGNQADNSAIDAGAVYVFVRNGTTWSQQAYLKASNTGSGDGFGSAVAVAGDTIVVGASFEDSNATGVNGNQADNSANSAGAAYVFVRNGTMWSQQAYLKASNTDVEDLFGSSVTVSGDTVVVGAFGEGSNATGVNDNQADNSAPNAGAAYVFVRNGTSWSQQAYLKASNTNGDDLFGSVVTASGDTVVVGAYAEESNATGVNGDQADNSAELAGAAYVFVRSGVTWGQQAYLKASNTGNLDQFGFSVALAGNTLAVGANGEASNAIGVNGDQADNSAVNAGAVYVFVRSGVTWSQQAYLKASNTGASDSFGQTVATSGDRVLVGAPAEDSNATGVNGNGSDNSATDAGAVYAFFRSGVTWSQQAYLKASNTNAGDFFGVAVGVESDTAVVGAQGEASNAIGINGNQGDNSAISAGAVYAFFTPPMVVNSLADGAPANDGQCTLREALLNAEGDDQSGSTDCAAGSGADTISFSVNGTISLTSALPNITQSLTLIGPGANLLTVSGNNAERVFTVTGTAGVNFSGLTVANGNTAGLGAGLLNVSSGTINITACAFTGNVSTGLFAGGAISTTNGAINVTNSQITGNAAGGGGGIFMDGMTTVVTLTNVTLSGNSATAPGGQGGAINHSAGTLNLTNCTIFSNMASGSGGGVALDVGTVNVRNTILAGNTAPGGPDVAGALTSLGNNLIGNTLDGSGFLGSDLQNVNPRLGVLANNGGATLTHGLRGDSPAIDAGSATGAPATDQRGFARSDDGNGDNTSAVDIGALEVQKLVVTNTNDSGAGSLRQAITTNETTGSSLIVFNVGSGTPTIAPTSALPLMNRAVTINGATGGATRVELNGTGAGAGAIGLNISANTVLKSLVINRFNTSSASAVRLSGDNNLIQNCYIGTNAAGTAALANNLGIVVASANNAIGSTTGGTGNVISGNTQDGLTFITATATGNVVQGNFIGTNAAGTAALANGLGISLSQGATNNTIGGSGAAAANVISGNSAWGVSISGAATTSNFVSGNLIGTNATGTAALANSFDGILINGGVNNTIGGTGPGTGNLLSGNGGAGLLLTSAATANNTVLGNFIGTNLAGTAALPNVNNGIIVQDAHDNIIGGTTAARRNLISGNTLRGILVFGATATGNLIQGNYIGTNAAGTAGLPNATRGVEISDSPGNTIGGTAAGAGNRIAFNTLAGVVIGTSTAINNRVLGNEIFSNGEVGIDLENNGLTANDAGDPDTGANNRQNFPELNFVTNGGYLGGSIGSTIANSAYPLRIEFFANTACDGLGNGEGEVFLGSLSMPAAGFFNFNFTPVGGKSFITATATDANGNTSEFSACRMLGDAPITVTTTADTVAADGLCSLREAIQAANTNTQVNECNAGVSGLDNIIFLLGSGTPTINVTSALPTITEPVVLNGGSGGATRVELNGTSAGAGANGLTISSGGTLVVSLVINRFGQNGILLQTAGGNTVQGCLIGTNAAGTAALANGLAGVRIDATPNNTIGGTTPGAINIISGNTGGGIVIAGAAATGNLIQGNYIGTNVTGNAALGAGTGITITSAPSNTIGGTVTGAANVISGNAQGVTIANATATGNLVQGNFIGTDAAGTVALPNSVHGIQVFAAANNTIGGTATGARNIIAGNTQTGLVINGAANTTVTGNYIGTNVNGTAALTNGAGGINIADSANCTIGGTTTAARNLISGNTSFGIAINQTGATGNVVLGNYIGTDVNGTAALANNGPGVQLSVNAAGNTIGGTAAGAGNVISGNLDVGISLTGATVMNNLVQGNFVGVNATGAVALPNTDSGILVNAPTNTIGGAAAGAGNILSGNGNRGLEISGAAASGNTVQGNYIGLNAAGTSAIGNANSGLRIDSAPNNFIGGASFAARNVISGNPNNGVHIVGATATGNQVRGNYIGTNAAGNAGVGNGQEGVQLDTSANNNLIGGTAVGEGNLIAFNDRGIVILTAASTGNRLLGNSVFSNLRHGIDLNQDGVTANDAGDADTGPNNLQNFPVLTSALTANGLITVQGTLNSTPSTVFRVELFANQGCDASGNGEGQHYLGFQSVTTDALGNANINTTLPLPAVNGLTAVTATATDASNNTSEFSACVTNCVYSIAPTSQAFLETGGTGSVALTATGGCNWTAVSNAPWLQITSASSGVGNATINFSVNANVLQTPRSGTLTIGNNTFTVTQAAAGLPVTTDFDGGIPPDWDVVDDGVGTYPNNMSATWTTLNPCNRVIPPPFQGGFAIMDSACASPDVVLDEQLIMAPFDATGLGQVILQFDNQFHWFSGGLNEVGDVDVTTNGGQSWTNVLRMQGGEDGFPNPNTKTINLTPALSGNLTNVRVRFRYYTTATPLRPDAPAGMPAYRAPQGPNVPTTQELWWGLDRPTILAFSISPTSLPLFLNGGTSTVNVTAAAGVAWTAQSNVAWIIPSVANGTGIGSVNVTVQANQTGSPRTGTVTIARNTFTVMQSNVCPPITINPTTPALTVATMGTPYTQTFTQTGVVSAVTWSNPGGGLPNGVTLNPSTGVLSGTPTAQGTFTFTIRATEVNNCFGERVYTLVVNPMACPTITVTPSNPNLIAGRVSTPYAQTFSQAGGSGAIVWSVSAGTLPNGLMLNSSSGALSGIPTVASTFNFTIRATDANNCSGERAYSLVISPPCATVTLNPASLPAAFVGIAYAQTVTATGGTAPYTFSITAGNLPSGLALASGGALTGSPTAVGTFNFTLTATDNVGCTGTRAYTVIVAGNGLQFYPLAAPVRLLDTRAGQVACSQPNTPIAGQTSLTQAGRSICGIPANAVALTGNITTVLSGGGFLTLYPSNAAQPTVASVNYGLNETINNVFTVGLGSDGAFKIFAFNTTDVVVDVTGYYAPPATNGLYFHPLPKPIRLLETRAGQLGCTTPGVPIQSGDGGTLTQQARITCDGVTIPSAALAIVGNATTVGPQGGGFLTLFPGNATRPLVASSNYSQGQIVNGPFSVGLAPNGEFKLYTFATTDLVVDVLGYYSTEVTDANGAGLLFSPLSKPVRLLETRVGQPVGCFKPGAPLNAQQEYTQTARGLCDGVTIPTNALAVVGNATVVQPNGPGFLTLWPSSAANRPTVATANYAIGEVVNRHFIVGLGNSDGAFKMYSFATSHLVIDLSGYFAP